MKQLKFLMVAFTLLMGVSFTSCLNDDAGESMYDGIGYVRTVMGSYFVDLYGNTYHPTMASVTEMEAQGFKMSGTVIFEIKKGPYQPLPSEDLASWAPQTSDAEGIKAFMKRMLEL